MARNIAKEMIGGLNELADAVRRGEDLATRFKVRDSRSRIPPRASDRDDNTQTESRLSSGEQQE